jgi:hypothetical protein
MSHSVRALEPSTDVTAVSPCFLNDAFLTLARGIFRISLHISGRPYGFKSRFSCPLRCCLSLVASNACKFLQMFVIKSVKRSPSWTDRTCKAYRTHASYGCQMNCRHFLWSRHAWFRILFISTESTLGLSSSERLAYRTPDVDTCPAKFFDALSSKSECCVAMRSPSCVYLS